MTTRTGTWWWKGFLSKNQIFDHCIFDESPRYLRIFTAGWNDFEEEFDLEVEENIADPRVTGAKGVGFGFGGSFWLSLKNEFIFGHVSLSGK